MKRLAFSFLLPFLRIHFCSSNELGCGRSSELLFPFFFIEVFPGPTRSLPNPLFLPSFSVFGGSCSKVCRLVHCRRDGSFRIRYRCSQVMPESSFCLWFSPPSPSNFLVTFHGPLVFSLSFSFTQSSPLPPVDHPLVRVAVVCGRV